MFSQFSSQLYPLFTIPPSYCELAAVALGPGAQNGTPGQSQAGAAEPRLQWATCTPGEWLHPGAACLRAPATCHIVQKKPTLKACMAEHKGTIRNGHSDYSIETHYDEVGSFPRLLRFGGVERDINPKEVVTLLNCC
ncbi:hypothetical protein AAFF_G00089600 [Aldrovandia affinis]|uniref:Uncharacterized protein n=1 Tax=Aldrovandia affinis TaxID=143900 RepID=A0AAD7RW22_9TELE|nr:hypothetical protein AAFF_G00089600 [Aldrovandia affinis]